VVATTRSSRGERRETTIISSEAETLVLSEAEWNPAAAAQPATLELEELGRFNCNLP